MLNLTKSILELAELAKRSHYQCEDGYFDCQLIKFPELGLCDCGVLKHNEEAKKKLKEILYLLE